MSKHRDEPPVELREPARLFIGGAFVRSESGRLEAGPGGEAVRASRKDVRDAVVAARAAFRGWSAAAPEARGRALVRFARALEARGAELATLLDAGGDARAEVDAAVDRVLWYAGWCDKAAAYLGTSLAVGAYDGTGSVAPLGVAGAIAPDEPALLGLAGTIVPPLVCGNTVVAIAAERKPRVAVVVAECASTSGLPPGVLNVLLGLRIELAPHLARHMDVDALDAPAVDGPFGAELERLAAENAKAARVGYATGVAEWYAPEARDIGHVEAFTSARARYRPAAI